MKKRSLRKLGRCYGCKRVMKAKYLEQVEFFTGHLHFGMFHHKLFCIGCIKEAEEISFGEED